MEKDALISGDGQGYHANSGPGASAHGGAHHAGSGKQLLLLLLLLLS